MFYQPSFVGVFLEKILSGKKIKIEEQEFIANRFVSGYPDIYIMNSDREIRVNIKSWVMLLILIKQLENECS